MSQASGKIYVIGTCDTKGDELKFACECLRAVGVKVVLVDVSTASPVGYADVTATEVAMWHPEGAGAVLGQKDRGQAVSAMGLALMLYVLAQNDVSGVLGMGGSGNTAIVTTAMKALPIGLPKVMVSTLASGNVAGFVGPSDIMLMPAVVDVAGLNAISRKIISNAAYAVAGMVQHNLSVSSTGGNAVGMTMFGVTTPCVTEIRKHLEPAHECFVFHATGTGGQSFEKLADSGFFKGVFDITTTEVADFLFGGTLPCTEDRFGAFIRNAVPYVGSVGAVDMINFGAMDTVPDKFSGRKRLVHNEHVTLVRTTANENRKIGEFIVARLNQMKGPVRFLLPLKGVSSLDAEGQPFYDPEADAALFDAIRHGWKSTSNHMLLEIDCNINDVLFAQTALKAFNEITG